MKPVRYIFFHAHNYWSFIRSFPVYDVIACKKHWIIGDIRDKSLSVQDDSIYKQKGIELWIINR